MKNYTCPECGEESETIGVRSECVQQLHIETDSYSNTDIEEAQHGFCLNCCRLIVGEEFAQLTGRTCTEKPEENGPLHIGKHGSAAVTE